MQSPYLHIEVIMLLFLIGFLLAVLVIARYVPQFGVLNRFAISREQMESSSLPLWVRMIVIPTAAWMLPFTLPLLYAIMNPEALSIWIDRFVENSPPPILTIPLFLLASIAIYTSRDSLSYYKETQIEEIKSDG